MSLTPQHRSAEATAEAMQEGLVAGGMVMVPTIAGIFIAMKQSPTFLQRTNWQSRTAIAIMPALFTFAWTSERHLEHKMIEIAQENQHSRETVKWAEEQHRAMTDNNKEVMMRNVDSEVQLMEMYRRSVEESGVCIVPGNSLGLHHRVANYVYSNPFKVWALHALCNIHDIFIRLAQLFFICSSAVSFVCTRFWWGWLCPLSP